MANQFPFNRLTSLENSAQELVNIAKERGPLVRDGKADWILEKTASIRKALDEVDDTIPNKKGQTRYVGELTELAQIKKGLAELTDVVISLYGRLAKLDGLDERVAALEQKLSINPPVKKKRGRPKKTEQIDDSGRFFVNGQEQMASMFCAMFQGFEMATGVKLNPNSNQGCKCKKPDKVTSPDNVSDTIRNLAIETNALTEDRIRAFAETHKDDVGCPFGGDTSNDCADCEYSGEYHWDEEKKDCVLRSGLDDDNQHGGGHAETEKDKPDTDDKLDDVMSSVDTDIKLDKAKVEEPDNQHVVNMMQGSVQVFVGNSDNIFESHEEYLDTYDKAQSAMSREIGACAYIMNSDHDNPYEADKAVQNILSNRYGTTMNSVRVWHRFGANDRKQIVRAYSTVLKKYAYKKYDDYDGIGSMFQVINYWFQKRFKAGSSSFRYNPACIPTWIENIVMVLGNHIHQADWSKTVSEFYRWCDNCHSPKFHYALPSDIMEAVQSNNVPAQDNMMVWDIMNALGFFRELNRALPTSTKQMPDIISWMWPQYALRYRLDNQLGFNPDDNSFNDYNRYIPGYSLTPENLSLHMWVDTARDASPIDVKMFFESAASKLVSKFMNRIVKDKEELRSMIAGCAYA